MSPFVVTARLKPGAGAEASRLVGEGPPFDLEASGLERHYVFLTGDEIIFLFEVRARPARGAEARDPAWRVPPDLPARSPGTGHAADADGGLRLGAAGRAGSVAPASRRRDVRSEIKLGACAR